MPLDIFVPFWGDPEKLRETVESVRAQSSDEWLLTVVDDAYPDTSVPEYFATLDDPRITYLRNESNLGITNNYRHCVELATQELVAMVGCDDLLLPNYVDTVLAAHESHPDVDMIQPGVQVIDENGVVVSTLVDGVKRWLSVPRSAQAQVVSGERLAASLLRANWLYWPSLVFTRESLRRAGFRDGYPIVQDLALEIDIICAGGSLLIEPVLCFSYRRHSASASSATAVDGSRFDGERRYFAEAAEQVAALGWRKAEKAARRHITSRAYALTLLPKALISGDGASARALLRHVVRT